MNKPFLTVFTPAYNRAHTLPRTYECMRQQKNTDFIWLIVDDGSSDNTAELVRQWQQEKNGFQIKYTYKENGGMHTAHNVAYGMIDTELNTCIDSDDALAPDAVQIIFDAWQEVRSKGYAGLIGLDADFRGNLIGTGFQPGLKDTTLEGFYRRGGRGDKKLVLRTDVVRQFPPYPVFEGERLVPLGSLYTMIDQKYRLCIVDRVLCLVEYQPDGSSRNILRQYYRSPRGFRYSRLVTLSVQQTLKRRVVLHVHYVAESMLAGLPVLRESPDPLMSLLTMPVGAALAAWIWLKNR